MTAPAPSPVRIAMWSGPRNISTAMMRSWGARPDTAVTDEPLYAHYLLATGRDHPGRDEVFAAHDTDWRSDVASLLGPVPGAKPIWFQKHMAHHLLPGMDRAWTRSLTNCFLIREPRAMLASLAKVLPNPTVEETGLPQQVELFESIAAMHGAPPAVVLSSDALRNPAAILRALCSRLGVPWTDSMLRWEPGLRETDGVWAKHWYDSVARSTGFEPYTPSTAEPPPRRFPVLRACEALFDRLVPHRLRAA